MPAQLHLAEDAFPLKLLLKRLERLVDVVVSNENLHCFATSLTLMSPSATAARGAFPEPAVGGHSTVAPPSPKGFRATMLGNMAILKIARMGHPVLLARAEPVSDPGDPEIRRLVADMIDTLEDIGGAGLAAPQVHVSKRLFIFKIVPGRAENGEEMPMRVVINPEITPLAEEADKVLRWEGCLSIPGLRAAVPRYPRIRYRGVDLEGNEVGGEAEGFHAGVVQHEYDHLDGVLYPMRMTDFSQFGFNEEMAKALATPPAAAR